MFLCTNIYASMGMCVGEGTTVLLYHPLCCDNTEDVCMILDDMCVLCSITVSTGTLL